MLKDFLTNISYMDYKEAITTQLSEIIYKEENISYDKLMLLLSEKPEVKHHKISPLLEEFLDEVECRVFDCLDSIKYIYPDFKLDYAKLRSILEKTIKVEEVIDDSYENEYCELDDTEYWFLEKLE
jgi:hypothetical protein